MNDSIESPCIQVCELDADDICLGCGRSLEEIGAWMYADDAERRAIVKRSYQRLAQVQDKRLG